MDYILEEVMQMLGFESDEEKERFSLARKNAASEYDFLLRLLAGEEIEEFTSEENERVIFFSENIRNCVHYDDENDSDYDVNHELGVTLVELS